MIDKAGWLLVTIGLMVVVTRGARPGTSPRPTKTTVTPESLEMEIESLKPARLAWREIAWKPCLLEGLKAAREQKKPIILWAFINSDPREERC